MKKNRLKCLISIINNFSCLVIFGVAVMSIVSPGYFVCHKSKFMGDESMEVQSGSVLKGKAPFGLEFYTKSMKKRVVESELEGDILDKVQQGYWALVSVAQQY
ncbi:MAG: hypothetical protein MRK01_06220 [Candidatus Scalindua sp.]|nr:hypothetical protein [Candidatus Scalindua sp.]